MLTWPEPPVGRARQKPLACETCLARRQDTHRAHAPCRGFLLCARLGNYERHALMPDGSPRWYGSGRAHEETATRTPLIDMETSAAESLTSPRKKMSRWSACGSGARLCLGANLFLSSLQKTAIGAVAWRAKRDVVQNRFISEGRMFRKLSEFFSSRTANAFGIRKVLRKMRAPSLQKPLFRKRPLAAFSRLAPRVRQGESPPHNPVLRIPRSNRARARARLKRISAAWGRMPNSVAISFQAKPSSRR